MINPATNSIDILPIQQTSNYERPFAESKRMEQYLLRRRSLIKMNSVRLQSKSGQATFYRKVRRDTISPISADRYLSLILSVLLFI
jgi:hypothetical protein